MRKLLIAVGALTVLAGCTSQASVVPTPTPVANSTTKAPVASPQPTPETAKQISFTSSPVASKTFNFPKAGCGDKPSGDKDTWYPVFVDGGDLETIRRNFCADATSTVRKDSQVQAVQVASFTNRDRASLFAKAVGGDVGQPTYPDFDSPSPQRQTETTDSASVSSSEAILSANDPDSQINLHDTPSATGRGLGYGLPGDRVEVIEQTTIDGYTWHKVRFRRSGAVGWVRGDFVSLVSAGKTSQLSEESHSSSPSPTYTNTTSTVSVSGGSCNSPSDLDSRGHRCGGRASSGKTSSGKRRR